MRKWSITLGFSIATFDYQRTTSVFLPSATDPILVFSCGTTTASSPARGNTWKSCPWRENHLFFNGGFNGNKYGTAMHTWGISIKLLYVYIKFYINWWHRRLLLHILLAYDWDGRYHVPVRICMASGFWVLEIIGRNLREAPSWRTSSSSLNAPWTMQGSPVACESTSNNFASTPLICSIIINI